MISKKPRVGRLYSDILVGNEEDTQGVSLLIYDYVPA
jgi:hypothetical protein